MIPSNNIEHGTYFLSCAPRKVIARKDTECTYCYRRIPAKSLKYYYSSGFKGAFLKGKGCNRNSKWFNLHIRCGVLLIGLNIEKLKNSI